MSGRVRGRGRSTTVLTSTDYLPVGSYSVDVISESPRWMLIKPLNGFSGWKRTIFASTRLHEHEHEHAAIWQ